MESATSSFFSWLRDIWTLDSYFVYKMGAVEVGSLLLGTGVHLAKRESDSITFSFVATKINLFHKCSQAPADSLESFVPESAFITH